MNRDQIHVWTKAALADLHLAETITPSGMSGFRMTQHGGAGVTITCRDWSVRANFIHLPHWKPDKAEDYPSIPARMELALFKTENPEDFLVLDPNRVVTRDAHRAFLDMVCRRTTISSGWNLAKDDERNLIIQYAFGWLGMRVCAAFVYPVQEDQRMQRQEFFTDHGAPFVAHLLFQQWITWDHHRTLLRVMYDKWGKHMALISKTNQTEADTYGEGLRDKYLELLDGADCIMLPPSNQLNGLIPRTVSGTVVVVAEPVTKKPKRVLDV